MLRIRKKNPTEKNAYVVVNGSYFEKYDIFNRISWCPQDIKKEWKKNRLLRCLFIGQWNDESVTYENEWFSGKKVVYFFFKFQRRKDDHSHQSQVQVAYDDVTISHSVYGSVKSNLAKEIRKWFVE